LDPPPAVFLDELHAATSATDARMAIPTFSFALLIRLTLSEGSIRRSFVERFAVASNQTFWPARVTIELQNYRATVVLTDLVGSRYFGVRLFSCLRHVE